MPYKDYAGLATGIGPMPGRSPSQAAELVAGELPIPHLVELPQRGVGSDMTGRSLAVLVDIPADLTPTGYRVGAARGRVMRTASDYLWRDLDALEESWETARLYNQPVKIQVCGPLTLAASVELPSGHRAIKDRSARRDLAASLAEGTACLATEIAQRTSACEVLVQIDEPMLADTVEGTVPALSRVDPVAPIPIPEIRQTYSEFAARVGGSLAIHLSAGPVPWSCIEGDTFDAVGCDISALHTADLDPLGALIDTGMTLLAGVIPTADDPSTDKAQRLSPDVALVPLAAVFDRLGFARQIMARQVIVTPTSGLGSADTEWARSVLAASSVASDALVHAPDNIEAGSVGR